MRTPKVIEMSLDELLQARRARHQQQVDLVRESVLLGIVAPNERRAAA